jgi:hypothetical protein
LNDMIEANPFLIYNTFIYSPDYYRLDEYYYGSCSQRWYAGRTFLAVDYRVFEDYCKKNNVKYCDYLINNDEGRMKVTSEFERHMNKLTKNHYRLPKDVMILCLKNSDKWGHNYNHIYRLLANFEFIDMVKLVKDLS